MPLVARGAHLDIVESNPRFVNQLRELVRDSVSSYPHGSGRATVMATSFDDFTSDQPYDVIVSGLPLKNFAPERVRSLMAKSLALLAPGGFFTAFSYLGSDRLRALTAPRNALVAHLKVDEVLHELQAKHGTGSVRVWWNLPPAEAWTLRS